MDVPIKYKTIGLASGSFICGLTKLWRIGGRWGRLERVPYTLALNDLSTCTSAILVVPKNCNVGLPRILSSANARGFSSRSNLDFPLGVDVTEGFPRSPDTAGTVSRERVKLRPSRTMYESESSSAPRYNKRWFATVDVDAFDASADIAEIHE